MTKRNPWRPTKYKPEYCDKLIEYFQMIIKTGNFPTFEGFAAEVTVSTETLQNWKEKYPDFLVSYGKALNMQKSNLFMKTLKKEYDSSFARFLSSACYGMCEKSQIDSTSSDGSMTPTINFIEK